MGLYETDQLLNSGIATTAQMAGLDSGVVVDVQIDLPNGPLRTKARVAQSFVDGDSLPGPAHYLTGLEFLGLAAADVPRLRSFIEAESRRSAGAGQTSS